MFVHFNEKLVNTDTIAYVTTTYLTQHGWIHVHFKDGTVEPVEGARTIELIMRLCPAALEGRQLKYIRHRWMIHNIFGHPLMQICSWLHLTSLALKIHDATIPNPITK